MLKEIESLQIALEKKGKNAPLAVQKAAMGLIERLNAAHYGEAKLDSVLEELLTFDCPQQWPTGDQAIKDWTKRGELFFVLHRD